ncbi:MAG TPA: hypothetical protein VLH39_05520 [Magnetospirillaceae bacterium]|nr:hypothetical protein [Magnetospirillaceae bacterium]
MSGRAGRCRAEDHQVMVSIPKSIDSRFQLFNKERAPHLSQNALAVEAIIYYLDQHNARYPEPQGAGGSE